MTPEALVCLRKAVKDLRAHGRGPIPHEAILALGETLGDTARVTLDLKASESLGVPLVVIRPTLPKIFTSLSPRERQVVSLVGEGLTNKAIAHRLSLSPATVKDHVHHILEKTGLPNRAAAVAHLRV